MKILTMVKLTGLVFEPSWGLCQSVISHGSLSIDALNSLLLENIITAARASIPTTEKGPPGPLTTLGGAMPAGRRSKTKDIITKSIGGIAHR